MILWITLISIGIFLIPITCLSIYWFYDSAMIYHGMRVWAKHYPIDSVKFKSIAMRPIRSDIKLPNHEKALLLFEVPSTGVAVNQKMYTGTTVSGINIPFAKIGASNRKFYNKKGWAKYSESRVYLTTTNIRAYAFNEPHRWNVPVHSVAEMRIVGYGKTVEIEMSNNHTRDNKFDESENRYRITFFTTKEALYFMHAVWTARFNGHHLYNKLEPHDELYSGAEPKLLTKRDVRRYKKELEAFPELTDMAWVEVFDKLSAEKASEKNHRKANTKYQNELGKASVGYRYKDKDNTREAYPSKGDFLEKHNKEMEAKIELERILREKDERK